MSIKDWMKMGFGLYLGAFLGMVLTKTVAERLKKEEENTEEPDDSRE